MHYWENLFETLKIYRITRSMVFILSDAKKRCVSSKECACCLQHAGAQVGGWLCYTIFQYYFSTVFTYRKKYKSHLVVVKYNIKQIKNTVVLFLHLQ